MNGSEAYRISLLQGLQFTCVCFVLNHMEGKKKMEEFVRRNFYSLISENLFINHYAKDEHDMVNKQNGWAVVV